MRASFGSLILLLVFRSIVCSAKRRNTYFSMSMSLWSFRVSIKKNEKLSNIKIVACTGFEPTSFGSKVEVTLG